MLVRVEIVWPSDSGRRTAIPRVPLTGGRPNRGRQFVLIIGERSNTTHLQRRRRNFKTPTTKRGGRPVITRVERAESKRSEFAAPPTARLLLPSLRSDRRRGQRAEGRRLISECTRSARSLVKFLTTRQIGRLLSVGTRTRGNLDERSFFLLWMAAAVRWLSVLLLALVLLVVPSFSVGLREFAACTNGKAWKCLYRQLDHPPSIERGTTKSSVRMGPHPMKMYATHLNKVSGECRQQRSLFSFLQPDPVNGEVYISVSV